MKNIYTFFILLSLFGCSSNVEKGSNGLPTQAVDLEKFNEWKFNQEDNKINNIEHLMFKGVTLSSELEIFKLKGGLNCIPAQIKISERLSKRFFSEYYSAMLTDAETTLVKWEKQNKKINSMLKEIHSETSCTVNKDLYLSEINKKISKIEKGGIFFELDSDSLTKESIRKTKQIIYLLKDFDINSATIIGHASEESSLEYGYKLGKKRSIKVKGVFLEENFQYEKIITRSYSKILNYSENKSQNRRVNVRIFENNLKESNGVNNIKINYRIKDWDIEKY